MSTIFIIHGSDGNPQENWFPWLKDKLEAQGHKVIVPQFPCEDGHILSRWFAAFEPYRNEINEDTIFVGHSRGCSFIWRLIAEWNISVKAMFYVGGFAQYLWYPEGPHELSTFFDKPFEWEKIKSASKLIKVYQSDNDPYVPISIGQEVADSLGVEMILVSGAGHFNTAAGYTKFPMLLSDIEKALN